MWACPDCIHTACVGLEIDSPAVRRCTPEEVDGDVDSDPEEEGFVLDEDGWSTTEADMESVDDFVFGIWSISHLRMLLNELPNFKEKQSHIVEVIQSRGHLCMFLPNFTAN